MTEDRAYQKVKFRQEVWHDEPYEDEEADFFDREDEKCQALNDLMSPSGHWTVWIVGERYAGKTSLLRLLCEKCRQANMTALEIPWQVVQSPVAFYREYLWTLDKSLNIPLDARQQFLCDPPNNTMFWQALEQRRSEIGEKRLVVGVDELDTILRDMGSDNQREMIGTLERLVSDGQKLIVTSTRGPENIETSAASPMVRRATLIELRPFSDKDMNALINAYLQPPSVDIQKQIRQWSGNWPFYAKAILYHYLLLPDVSDRFKRALSDAVNTVTPACEHLYLHHWDDDERRALLLLTREKGISAVDLNLLGPEAVTAFKNLTRRGYLLQDEQERYRFRVRLIEEWFRQWPHRELQELKLGLETWLRVLAWRQEPGEKVIRVTRDELRRSGF